MIDCKGSIYVYENKEGQQLDLVYTLQHESSTSFGLEESWCTLAFSPSGKRVC